jgi:hypothetical protein
MVLEEKNTRDGKMPPKYINLKRLKDLVPVPSLFCITEKDLSHMCQNFHEISDKIKEIIESVHITSGTFLREHLAEIQRQSKLLQFHERADGFLSTKMKNAFGPEWEKCLYAVRSAGLEEDSFDRSFAGLHESVLNVTGMTGLKASIKTVWKSAFSRAAFTEYLDRDRVVLNTGIQVIIQRMVQSLYSGVAFTRDPVTGENRIVVEYIYGLGEKLVSGRIVPDTVHVDRVPCVEAENEGPEFISKVTDLVQKVQAANDWDVDVEWAWDGQTAWLLQVRPITTLDSYSDHQVAHPDFEMVELYGDDQSAIDALGQLPDFGEYFRTKRKPIYDFARKHGLGYGGAYVLRLNLKGLAEPCNGLRLVEAFSSKEVVLDFNSKIRQVILPRENIIVELEKFITHPDRIHTLTLRDFFKGEMGLITKIHQGENGSTVLCEFSKDGLLAINRGTAVSSIVMLPGERLPKFMSASMARQLELSTRIAQTEIGHIQIEWVYDQGRLFPVDFSAVTQVPTKSEKENECVISSGFAYGEAFIIKNNTDLERLSIAPAMSLTEIPDAKDMGYIFERFIEQLEKCDQKPILLSPRPYAALASLIPYVKGFVFEHASLLCHLAILLREKRIPAVNAAEMYNTMLNHQQILIDTKAKMPLSII